MILLDFGKATESKLISGEDDVIFLGEDNEWLVQYCKHKLTQKHRSHFIFGHRHLPMQVNLPDEAVYTNLGDWCSHFTFAVFNGKELSLESFEKAN